MPSILVVCTGNVCRSPIAEGLLRSSLERRFGERAPSVASAGTAGWEGSGAAAESVLAAEELGVDISHHRARRLLQDHVVGASLVLCMAAEHRQDVVSMTPSARPRTFTLKELVRLLEAIPGSPVEAEPVQALRLRVAGAAALRQELQDGRWDQDVADPLGRPLRVYRHLARELDEWCGRLAEGLFGRATSRAFAEGE